MSKCPEHIVSELRIAAIEHAMRLGMAEDVVLAIRVSAPQSQQAFKALGRASADGVAAPQPGSPLYVWCVGGVVADDWRSRCPVAGGGMWAELELAFLVNGGDVRCGVDTYEQLLQVRAELAD